MTPAEIASCGAAELTTKQWLHLAEEAIKNETLYLMLTGGEPLLREDFSELYTEISRMGFMVFLNTNATMMDEEHYKLFSKYPPTATSVTLYGADAATYHSICGSAEGFDRTIRGLEYLADVPTLLEVRTTFVKDNKDQLDRLREIANRYTKRYAINHHVFKAVEGVVSSAEQVRLTAKECYDIEISNAEYYQELRTQRQREKEAASREGEKLADGNASPAAEASQKEEKKDQPIDIDRGVGVYPEILACLASKAMYSIRWDGKMLPCGAFSSPYTLPLDEGFKQAWERLPHLVAATVKHPQQCIECALYDACPNCPSYIQAETGSFDQVPAYICSLAKERHSRYAMKM